MKISIIEKSQAGKVGFAEVRFSDEIFESRFLIEDGKKVLEIKIPKKEKLNWRQTVLIPRMIVAFAKRNGVRKISLVWSAVEALKLGDVLKVAEAFAINFEMANYEFLTFKTKPVEGWNLVEEINVFIEKQKGLKEVFAKGQLIGQETNACRDLVNTPGGDMTPEILERETRKAIKNTGISIKTLDESAMQKLGMNAILNVGKGSKEKSKFIILEYGEKNQKNPIVLIGKGITFDSGGLNIKTGDSMSEMNMDMSGGAAVIHAMIAAAKIGVKTRVIGLIPAVESMPSGESFRPGDIIKSMSGQTIEVQNTDAEGRLILADAHTFAERYKPAVVVTVSTLTGAASVALGERASALLTKDEKLSDLLRQLGEESGDYLWPLPLWDEFETEVKGTVADLCNIRNRQSTRDGGTILGGMFIYQFAKKFSSWAHIDIAPRMTAVYDEALAQGASGVAVRLLTKLIEKF